MQIVGTLQADDGATCVHTIDVWFSGRAKRWCVERLDEQGNLIGAAYHGLSEADAIECVAEWLRAHPETHLVAPREAETVARIARRAA